MTVEVQHEKVAIVPNWDRRGWRWLPRGGRGPPDGLAATSKFLLQKRAPTVYFFIFSFVSLTQCQSLAISLCVRLFIASSLLI